MLVRYTPAELELEVSDDGRGGSNGTANGSGHGLVGMRERVSLYGGELETGSSRDGGYVVHARLPLGVDDVTIRLLLADDQELVRTGFRLILNAEPDLDVAGEAGDGSQAVDEAARLRPDVVLMDVRMPGVDGIEATRRLGRLTPNPPRVLMLTTFDLDQYVV